MPLSIYFRGNFFSIFLIIIPEGKYKLSHRGIEKREMTSYPATPLHPVVVNSHNPNQLNHRTANAL